MSPPSGDVPLTPDNKAGSGLASVFKTFTSRVNRPPTSSSNLAPSATALIAQQLSRGANGLPKETYSGPANLEQLYLQICSGQPLPERVAAAEGLRHVVEEFSLSSIMGIWAAAKDLTDKDLPAEARQAGFDLLTACIRHSEPSPLERREFFDTVAAPCNSEDFHLQLSAMVELANGGKDLSAFEKAMMPLIIDWLGEWFKASAIARKKEKERPNRSSAALGEETNLNQLFSFINSVIRFNHKTFHASETTALLGQTLAICKRTTAEMDIRNAISLIDNLITYGDIPRPMLEPCLDVLCGTYITLNDLAEPAWNAICNLCKSHLSQTTLLTLLDIVRSPSNSRDRNTNTIRGAVSLVYRILKAQGADNLPSLSFSVVVDAFQKSLAADSLRLELEVLDSILRCLEVEDLFDVVQQEDNWTVLLDILVQCSSKATSLGDIRSLPSTSSISSISTSKAKQENGLSLKLANTLRQVMSHLEALCTKGDFLQKQSVIDFFMTVHIRLPDSCVKMLIRHHVDEHLLYPFNPAWLEDSRRLIEDFFRDVSRPATVRLLVLTAVKDVFDVISQVSPMDVLRNFISPLFDYLLDEEDVHVLESLVAFAVGTVANVDGSLADFILERLIDYLPIEEPTANSSPTSSRIGFVNSRPTSAAASYTRPTTAGIIVSGIVRLFVHSIDVSAATSAAAFDTLLKVVKSRECDTDAKLNAMKLLFCVRSDWTHAILIADTAECETLAATLNRTISTFESRMVPEDAPPSRQSRKHGHDDADAPRSSRSISATRSHASVSRSNTARTTSSTYHHGRPSSPLWMFPDGSVPSEEPVHVPSSLLYSVADALPSTSSRLAARERRALNINIWLEVLISAIQQGGDWEIYSYVLVHLGAQLTNHTLFAGAVPQLQMLRNVLCEQVKANSFFEPPPSSGVKKVDVSVCIIYALTILLTYHEHFSKNEQDEIVRSFMLGLGSHEKTSKSCIHALSVCCHELPLSVSKSLNTILQKMSQIITQSYVAVHILEFLGCLSRMPEVYVNFREDDYRTIFGICFRYLQYVRDQRHKALGAQSFRGSNPPERSSRLSKDSAAIQDAALHPNLSDDLPQYVFALAYHVITFWFMSLKLIERSKHVGWITKNLVSIDSMGHETIDEQSQVTIDMMQRVTYSDIDETIPDVDFSHKAQGPIAKKSWLVGLSILTVETAVKTGLSQLTKRQPSATTYSTYRSTPAPRPQHQIPLSSQTVTDAQDEASRIVVLPNHILLQLVSSSSKIPERLRPIPLPEEDATQRALNTFDRNSTVDGHKVGIIYMGEDQTSESEILANTIGSADYTDFLSGLGNLVRLKGAQFNTQGLDRENDMDGKFAICWRDRVTEIVFHVTTMMPTDLEHDARCINKKRHTGNDFVNIIFNDSGHPFRFDTFPSDFNSVNIVITPESRASFTATHARDWLSTEKQFYKVQVMSKLHFPKISPAAGTKVVSGKSLPVFVRLLALNASVFSLVWSNREGGEHISSWRNRLREIMKLRERYSPSSATASASMSTSPPPNPVSSTATTGVGAANNNNNTGIALTSNQSQGGREGASQRDSIPTRRTSAATFFTESSHRSSMLSTATTATETDAGASVEGDGLADG
ncbi:MAG: hypothetical protein M1825_003074 [Sarcosagium campestre]|nr:MAG: hypothetical protein M1825_003074 [Sarcosagium campestre]